MIRKKILRLLFALLAASLAASAYADISINAGGGAMGNYAADQNFSGGSAYSFGNQSGIYNTERWSSTGFSYAIPVTAGSVEVTLRFRESCTQCTYKRVFSVQAEDQVVLSNFSVALNTIGDRVFTVNTDGTLNLIFRTITGESWVNAIEVRQLGAQLPVVKLSASPTSVSSGGSSILTWSATNATSCTASGAWSGARATSGSIGTGALGMDSTYALTCTGPGGQATATTTVAVAAVIPPPVVTLVASTGSVGIGGSSTLTWSATNATSCVAGGAWSGSKSIGGSQSTGALTGNATYTITCTGAGGTVTQSVTVAVTASSAPTLVLSASPESVAYAGTSRLTWSATDATSCVAGGAWSGTKATSGSQTTGSLSSSRTYSLTCTGPNGTVTQSATVTVVPRPTVTMSASPEGVATGGYSTLSWTSTSATSCTASGDWSGSKAMNGSETVGPLSSSSTFTLTCTGIGGSRNRSVYVAVTAPVTVSLSSSPGTVASGGTSTLSWTSTGATGCTASGAWSGSKSRSGVQTVGPLSATSTFILTCSSAASNASSSTTISVNTPTTPTVSLAASPTAVASGATSTLTWSSNNTTGCVASGAWSGTKATSGSESTGPVTAAGTYTLTCTGASGSASATASVGLIDGSGAAFPLHAESGKRYLVDAEGKPFLIHGDTPWSLIVQLTKEDADRYLEDRRAKGFNTILVNLIEHRFAANAPLNRYGETPFDVAGDFSRPNERYFAHADYVIAKAAEKGILVMLAPAYAGFGGGGEGWWQEMQANGATKLRAYGQYVANRYKGFSNILWVHGGDFDVTNKDLVRAIANGIRDIDPQSLHTYHGGRGTGALEFFGTAEPWLGLNNIYTNSTYVVSEAYQEYQRSVMPFFFIEGDYENYGINEQGLRTQAYQAVLSGASGQLMGNWPIWHFNSPTADNPSGQTWQQALNSPGARSMQKLREFMGGFAWWTLVPDTGASFVTGGISGAADRAAAARAGDGSVGVVYLPSRRNITVNLAQIAGPRAAARWCDPVSGTCTAASGSPFTASGSRTFTPPGNNSSGYGDWLLVVEATQ